MAPQTALIEQRLRIRNNHPTAVTLVLDPWGDAYQLAPSTVAEIVIQSSVVGIFDVETHDDSIIVWGWEGAYLSLLQDGQVVRDSNVG